MSGAERARQQRIAPPPPARKALKPADMPPETQPASPPASPAASPPASPAVVTQPMQAPLAAAGRSETLTTQAQAASTPAPSARLRREAAAADTFQDSLAKDPRAAELERIARLRAEGRHDEADKALETFRRAHPDYRIPEAMWERVRPR